MKPLQQTDTGKYECQLKNNGFCIEIIINDNSAKITITHLCGNEVYTHEIFKALKAELNKQLNA